MFGFHKQPIEKTYDKELQRPVLKCSICNGEKIAGFKNLHTGKFEEVMLIKSEKDLDDFKNMYDIKVLPKEY